jgi:hypothetical protein
MLRVARGERPDRPIHQGATDTIAIGHEWWSLAQQCWNANPAARPSMGTIHQHISTETLPTGPWTNADLAAQYLTGLSLYVNQRCTIIPPLML